MKILARLRSDQRGLTLTEVLVAMMVMSLAAGVFLSTLASVQKSVAETDIRTWMPLCGCLEEWEWGTDLTFEPEPESVAVPARRRRREL